MRMPHHAMPSSRSSPEELGVTLEVEFHTVHVVVRAKFAQDREVVIPHLRNHVVEEPDIVTALAGCASSPHPVCRMLAPNRLWVSQVRSLT